MICPSRSRFLSFSVFSPMKLRVPPIWKKLDGTTGEHVEIDETGVGGRTRGEGRGIHHKVLVACAVEVRHRKPGTAQDKRKDGRYAGRVRLGKRGSLASITASAISIFKPPSMSSRSVLTGASPHLTASARCSALPATSAPRPSMNSIPGNGNTLHVVGECVNRIGKQETKKQQAWRFIIQKHLLKSFRDESGATFYTPFFIKSNNSNRSYWLVHLSMHERARNEMIQGHWELQNHVIHHGGAGLNMLGYDPTKDELITGQIPMYLFDKPARDQSLRCLESDLPSWIKNEGGKVLFGDIIRRTINTSPAHEDMYKDALFQLSRCGEIEVQTPKERERRVSSQISADDEIRLKKQTQFHVMKPTKN